MLTNSTLLCKCVNPKRYISHYVLKRLVRYGIVCWVMFELWRDGAKTPVLPLLIKLNHVKIILPKSCIIILTNTPLNQTVSYVVTDLQFFFQKNLNLLFSTNFRKGIRLFGLEGQYSAVPRSARHSEYNYAE